MIRVIVLTNPKYDIRMHVLDRGDYTELLTDDKVPFRRWYHTKSLRWILYKGLKFYK